MDLFSYARQDFLLMVDHYSDFWEIDLLPDLSAGSISDQQRLPLHSQRLTKNGHLSSLWTRVQLTGAMQVRAMQRKSSAAMRRLQGYQP
ncbi:unnamed protein product [Boreogadus saida]